MKLKGHAAQEEDPDYVSEVSHASTYVDDI